MFKYSFQNISSLWVSRLKSCMYLSTKFACTPTHTSVLVLIPRSNIGRILYIIGVTAPSWQFLCQKHVQNHSKPYTILILMKILANSPLTVPVSSSHFSSRVSISSVSISYAFPYLLSLPTQYTARCKPSACPLAFQFNIVHSCLYTLLHYTINHPHYQQILCNL